MPSLQGESCKQFSLEQTEISAGYQVAIRIQGRKGKVDRGRENVQNEPDVNNRQLPPRLRRAGVLLAVRHHLAQPHLPDVDQQDRVPLQAKRHAQPEEYHWE